MIRKALFVMVVMLGALALAPAAGAQYQPGQPAVVLTPSTITPGGKVTALGFGCGANQQVEVTINGVVVATTISKDDGQGSFEVTFTAPDTPGQYTIVVRCGVTIVSSILTVIAPVVTVVNNSSNLPQTGSSESLPLARAGLVLMAGGGLIVLAVRRRREN